MAEYRQPISCHVRPKQEDVVQSIEIITELEVWIRAWEETLPIVPSPYCNRG